jgi:uncharacterized protein (TIGR02145 family)
MTRSKKTVFLFFLLTGCFIISTCERKFEKVMNVSTGTSTDITSNSATVSGQIIDLGEGATQYGHYYGKTTGVKNTGIKTTNGVPKGTVSFTSKLNNLDAGIKYYYQAYLTDGKEIVYGSEISFSTIPSSTVPGAPTIGIATAGNAQATVTFTSPASNGGSNITGYTVTSSPGGFIATGSASPITVTGLTNGTAYTFTVTATNANGTGPASSASNSVTPAPTSTVPGAPTIGTATAGNAQATITFTAPGSNGGSAITSYTVTSSPGGITATGSASPVTVTGLTNGTAYTFTVTATNAIGTGPASSASNSVTLSSFNCGTRLLDSRDGKTYLTVQIGNQCWFAENLNVGIRIDGTNDQLNNAIIEKYCYDNSESNCNLLGGLYQWDEMMQYSITEMTQGICPVGWHIPSDYEWKVMEMTLGMDPTVANAAGWRGTVEGGKLKAAGTQYWDSPNTGATNSSQFTALPSGDRTSTGTFESLGYFTDFWTSTFIIDTQCWYRYLDADHSQIYRIDGNRKFGTPVRCVKD